VKYLKRRKAGDYRYRRRVPQGLSTVLGKTEFVKVLGRSEIEAIKAYADFHDHVEALIRTAGKGGAAPDPRSIKEAIHSLFSEGEFDPNSTGKTVSEKAARDDLADRIFRRYPVDEETGYPDPMEMTPLDSAMATALLAGVHAVDLTSARWQVMGTIVAAARPQPVAWLARDLGANRQNVQRIVNDLHADGLVAFAPNPHHRRAQLVVLTEKGQRTYDAAIRLYDPSVNDLADGLPVAEIETARRVLDALRTRLEGDADR
jgi:DNA-binding MarR family transcriptional regulator